MASTTVLLLVSSGMLLMASTNVVLPDTRYVIDGF